MADMCVWFWFLCVCVAFRRGDMPPNEETSRHKGSVMQRRLLLCWLLIEPIGRLGPVSFLRCRNSTPGLST